MVVGLGTGSTAAFFLTALAQRLSNERLRIVGVPTSEHTAALALQMEIPLTTFAEHQRIDLTVDGADEVELGTLSLIKGHGGALLREKIVATRSARWILVIDPTKLVPHLGARYPLPVEVVTFGWQGHFDTLRALGAEPALRSGGEHPFVTDEGHYLIDARFPNGIADPDAVHRTLRARPGVVDTGLFLGLTSDVIVGAE